MERSVLHDRAMRIRHVSLIVVLFVPVGCGGVVGSSGGEPTGAGGSGGAIGPKDVIARFVTTTANENGNYASDGFTALLGSSPTEGFCSGAIRAVGACCLFPAPRPQPDPVPGSGSAPPAESAGTLQVADATTHASIATYPYRQGNYVIPPDYPAGTWSAGDQLTVSATGGAQIGAFAVTGPALVPPFSSLPTSINQGSDLTVSWTPQPDSQTMMISLDTDSGAMIACSVPEAQGKVTIDASLLPSSPQVTCQMTAVREADHYAQTPKGRVMLESVGYASNLCTWK